MSDGVTVQVLGTDKLRARIAITLRGIGKDIAIALRTGAFMVHKDAVDSLTASGKTGHIYSLTHPTRNHQASAPGEAPASDTGELRQGIIVVMDADGMGASVISRAKYSAALEFGTIDMAPRPFMGPAYDKNKDAVSKLISDAVAAALEKGKP